MSQSKLMTINETKREYHFSHTGLYRAIKACNIEAVKVGRSTFVLRESVDQYLKSLPRLGRKSVS